MLINNVKELWQQAQTNERAQKAYQELASVQAFSETLYARDFKKTGIITSFRNDLKKYLNQTT